MATPVAPRETLSTLSRLPSLSFPPPHRLGTSSGIRLSKPSLSNLTAASSNTYAQPSSSSGLTRGSSWETGPIEGITSVDEPDSAAAVKLEKPVSSLTKHRKEKVGPRTAIITTQSGRPLDNFVLFLPPNIPQAIFRSRLSLLDYVKSTVVTYLGLWKLASKVGLLDLRLPPPYMEQLCEEYAFLSQLLSDVFNLLQPVKSIEKLYLPQIRLTTRTEIDDVLTALSETTTTVGHVFLSLDTSIQKSELSSFDYKAIALCLRKSGIGEITLVSSNEVVQAFRNKLHTEIKKSKRAPLKVSYSSREMGLPGPSYIAELGKKPQVGEAIEPQKLVGSLNVSFDPDIAEEGVKGKHTIARTKVLKDVSLYILYIYVCPASNTLT